MPNKNCKGAHKKDYLSKLNTKDGALAKGDKVQLKNRVTLSLKSTSELEDSKLSVKDIVGQMENQTPNLEITDKKPQKENSMEENESNDDPIPENTDENDIQNGNGTPMEEEVFEDSPRDDERDPELTDEKDDTAQSKPENENEKKEDLSKILESMN